MPVTGQLWYSTEGNLADARAGYVNSDSNTTTVVVDNSPTTDLVTGFTEEIVFDTAAGLYYVLVSGNQGVNARLLVGQIGSSAPPTVAFTFDPTFAGSENNLHFGLHIDSINERIYVGSIALNPAITNATQGVRQLTYNPATGSVTDNGLVYTQAVAGVAASAPGATALFIPRDFDIDSTHNVMYSSTYALGDGTETNALVRINLANLSAPAVSLVDPALFPLDNPPGPPVGSDDFNTLNGIIQDVEVDVDSDRVYFSTHAEEVDEGGAGGDPEDAIWMVANASTAANATPTKLVLSAGSFAASFVTTNFYPGDMVLDEVNDVLYVESENSNAPGGGTGNADVILKFQLNSTGTTATLIDVINVGFSGTGNIEGMAFNQLAEIANVNGTTTHAVQQGSAITLLTVDPTITDFDGDHLAGATVAISGSSAGAGDNLTAIGGQTSGVIAGTNITVTRTTDGSGNQTLTFTGYDTLANYQTVLGDVRFDSTNGGGTTRTITWQVNDGAAGNPSGTVNGTDTNVRTTSITIDPPTSISVNDVTQVEGNSGTVSFTFTVGLSAASASTVTVDYATANGTAVAGSDYATLSGPLIFAPGVTTQTVTVLVNGDTLNEANETFFLNLSNATNGSILDGQGLGTIINDDPTPTISVNDPSVTEGNAGTTTLTYTVTLNAASAQAVTVNYATADGTALAGTDYTAASGTLTFAPGVTTQTITVLVNGDTLLEPDEAFTVALSGPTNATIADNSGTGTIDNDDNDPPTADNVGPVAGTEDQPARIAITLSGNDTDVGDAVTQFLLQTLPAGGQVFTTNSGGTALTAGAAIPATGSGPYTATVWFQPNADFNGTDSFTYQADDGTDLSAPATVSLDIAAVNDAPSFDVAGNQNVTEDDGAITVSGFASNFQPGPATATDEAGQTLVGYTVTTDNAALFAVGPAISNTGQLTYTLADDANGVANVTVVAADSGPSGGANVNQATRTFAINVAPVADAPIVAAPLADQFGNVDIAFAFAVPAGTFTDADGDPLTLTATLTDGSSLPAGISFDPVTGTFTGELDVEQTFDIRVTASDGSFSVSDDFRLTIRAMPEPTDKPPLLIASSRTATVPENTTATGILLTPSDDNPGTFFEVSDFTLTGADAQLFQVVQTARGFELVFRAAPDFENPADAGDNNVYDVSVWVRNAGQNSATVSLGVTVSDVAEGTDGTPGDDDLNGTAGDDVFRPLGGDDDVSGGAGDDTVVLPGGASGYVFVQLISGDIGVIDIDPSDGDQGSDVLDSIEFVRFADGINVDAESLISREQAPWMLDTSDVEIVAATWQLLMGFVPTEGGFQYLISSPDNPTDLNDPYFLSFNMENKYLSFMSNLATETAGSKEWFDREFGGLTYQQAVEKAFNTIVTAAALIEAGGDPAASKAFFLNAESYFNAVAAERIVRPGVDLAEATKIALLSSVLHEAVKAGIGPYAEQVDEFATDLARVGYSTEFHSNLFETA